MSASKDGGPAFPHMARHGGNVVEQITDGGMTLRDYFAAKAMAAMFQGFADADERARDTYRICSREAYSLADAMLAEREKGGAK